ncbi:hypothetical protein HBA55_12015 [Pseudomaricurvus alkylphenolicus]|uniref:VOC family protein n=1 Tax=Pseudomaricurvus alkylphenolicus TaxID=1306991 RepID=UPI0014227773|nr:VOC family protein [Pseudomaricurvus alkylphenolicus]NIB40317.1 hypothetical protein [Pseudomaricurvus alkylphenolicus]
MSKQLKGVVIRVKDLEEARIRYSKLLGVEATEIPAHCFSEPGVVAGIRFDLGESFVQFVAGIGGESPVTKATEKLGEGINQLSFWVDDLDREVALFQEQGVRFTFADPEELPLGRVMFGHPKTLNGVMWELEEHAND